VPTRLINIKYITIRAEKVASPVTALHGHNRHGPKIGEGAPPPFWGGAGSPSNTKFPWDEAYLHTKWDRDASNRLCTINMGENFGARPLFGEGSVSPSNTMSPGLSTSSIASGILVHLAV